VSFSFILKSIDQADMETTTNSADAAIADIVHDAEIRLLREALDFEEPPEEVPDGFDEEPVAVPPAVPTKGAALELISPTMMPSAGVTGDAEFSAFWNGTAPERRAADVTFQPLEIITG